MVLSCEEVFGPVLAVEVAYDFRLSEIQQIVVALEVNGVVLELASKCSFVPPVSMIVPPNSDGARATTNAPAGFVTLSAATPPDAVNVSRDGGALPRVSQRWRFRSCACRVKSRTPKPG